MTPRHDREAIARFLGSAAAAFPLTPDPWASLAHGLRLSREELAGLVDDLQRDGIIAGLRGEPNPALPSARTQLVEDASAGGIVRWEAALESGGGLVSVCSLGPGAASDAKGLRFFKCGFTGALLSGEEGDPLAQETDRTVRPSPDQPCAEDLPPALLELRDAFLEPLPLEPRADFWEWFAGGAGMEPGQARKACRDVILGGHWRRLAVAVHPTAAGLAGCGMAWWKFPNGGDANGAAAALAALRSTADVALREGEEDWELSALFAGREPGSGEWAAREVARQWGRNMARWEPFTRLRVDGGKDSAPPGSLG